MPPNPELIRIENLSKEYRNGPQSVQVLHDIKLSIGAGEFVAIMGPSGSGKSTFMNILGCLDTPSSGRYFLNGRDVSTLASDELANLRNATLGFVFQGFNLLKRASALENVALPLLYADIGVAARTQRALALLEQIGLEARRDARPNELSGGQQQRVAIARALANNPQIILADEPTGNLDSHTSQEIMAIFSRLNQERGITIVLVTHEADIARYAKRLVRFVDGKIVHDGAVDV
ncbi:MAG: ABC transporter ATP-binding protein [Sulfuricellaceae bacterium]|nr:ABC transporter ATP-binding protein [Sulfuricellaceae bacterium]